MEKILWMFCVEVFDALYINVHSFILSFIQTF